MLNVRHVQAISRLLTSQTSDVYGRNLCTLRILGHKYYLNEGSKSKVKVSLEQAVEAVEATVGSQMAVRLSDLRAGRHLLPGIFLVLISVRG
jgi:hypothetical protein